MALTIFRRGWWYLLPPTRIVLLQKLVKIQEKFQSVLSATVYELLNKKSKVNQGVPEADEESQYKAIEKHVSDYSKRSWLVRAWWWLSRQHTDIPVKRLWLSYQACKALQGSIIINETGMSPNNLNLIMQLNDNTRLLPSWQRIINNMVDYISYFNVAFNTGNRFDSAADVTDKHASERLNEPLLHAADKNGHLNSQTQDALVKYSTAHVISSFPESPEIDLHKEVSALAYASGFFGLSLMDATPAQINRAIRENEKIWHPDKTEMSYVDYNGEAKRYSDKALEFYRHHRGLMFDMMRIELKKVNLPKDKAFITKQLIANDEIKRKYALGKSYRLLINDAGSLDKEVAGFITFQEETHVRLDQQISDIADLSNKAREIQNSCKETNNSCKETINTCNETNNSCKETINTCNEIMNTCNETINTCNETNNSCKEINDRCKEMHLDIENVNKEIKEMKASLIAIFSEQAEEPEARSYVGICNH